MRFNEMLRMLREQRGITQEDLAKILNMTKHAISKYELGERTPDPEVILKLANYFGVTVDYLLGNDATMKVLEDDPPLLSSLQIYPTIIFYIMHTWKSPGSSPGRSVCILFFQE